MATLVERRYPLHFYTHIEQSDEIKELSDEIIQKINKLSSRVGAPSYQKTPVFKRNSYNRNKHIKRGDISEEDWNTIRNFKTTKLEKNQNGIEAKMDKIRSSLNKLTDQTYEIMFDDIVSVMKEINKEENEENFEKIGESIFVIGSFNKFWSSLYARLYKDLIAVFPIMKDICLKNFKSFKGLFDNINYVDAGVDYNLFCECNKENEKRRALSNFFIICANNEIIDKTEMSNIIIGFLKKIPNDMILEGKSETIAEITENVCIMIRNGINFLQDLDDYDWIISQVERFSLMNHKKYASLTSKVVFKFMDLHDELED